MSVGNGFCSLPVPLSQINMVEKMVSLSPSDGYLKYLAQETKKNDTAFMDIIKEFPVIYNLPVRILKIET